MNTASTPDPQIRKSSLSLSFVIFKTLFFFFFFSLQNNNYHKLEQYLVYNIPLVPSSFCCVDIIGQELSPSAYLVLA